MNKKFTFLVTLVMFLITNVTVSVSAQTSGSTGSPDRWVRGLKLQGQARIQNSHRNDVAMHMRNIRQNTVRNKVSESSVSEDFKSQLHYLFNETYKITPTARTLYLFFDQGKPRSGSIYFISYENNSFIVSRYKIEVRRGARFGDIFIPDDFIFTSNSAQTQSNANASSSVENFSISTGGNSISILREGYNVCKATFVLPAVRSGMIRIGRVRTIGYIVVLQRGDRIRSINYIGRVINEFGMLIELKPQETRTG